MEKNFSYDVEYLGNDNGFMVLNGKKYSVSVGTVIKGLDEKSYSNLIKMSCWKKVGTDKVQEVIKSEIKNDTKVNTEIDGDYYKKLESINGISPKTAGEIYSIFPNEIVLKEFLKTGKINGISDFKNKLIRDRFFNVN